MSMQTASNNVPSWSVGDRLRKARETAGLSQSALSELTGISRRTITSYEGGTTPKRTALLAWSMATGVPLDWLLTGDTGPDTPGGLPNHSSRCTTDDLASLRARRSSPALLAA